MPCRMFALLLAVLAISPCPAAAQILPAGPIRIIVPAAPGGASDLSLRSLAELLQKALGQPVVVENRAGADGILAAQAAALANGDGGTLLLGTTTTQVANAVLRRRLPYDPARDFAPVTMVGTTALVLLVHPDVPAGSVQELIAHAQANPGKLTFASSYASSRMAGELFKQMARIDLLNVPYKTTQGATTDLVGGQIQMMFGDLWSALPHIRSGRLRALAVTTPQRVPFAAHLPTVAESGLPGYEMIGWAGLFVPSRTPPAIIARLNAELVPLISSPEFRKRMLEAGSEVSPGTPEAFRDHLRSEVQKWRRLAEQAHIEIAD